MTADKRRLGRGLEALLPDGAAPAGTGSEAAGGESLEEALMLIRQLRFENRRLLAELETLNILLQEADDLIRKNLN